MRIQIFWETKHSSKISILKKNKFQKSQVWTNISQILGLKMLAVLESLHFRILSIYYLNIKFSLKIFHFLYLLAATWVLKMDFVIAIVIFFFLFSKIWLEFECVPKIHFPYPWHCWINPKTGIVLRSIWNTLITLIRSLRTPF